MRSLTRLCGVSFCLAAIGHLALAQTEGTLLAEVSHKTEYDKSHFKFTKLRDSGKDLLTKDDVALMDLAAKYYIYRVTSHEAKQDSKIMLIVVKDFEAQMDAATRNLKLNNNPEFIKGFTKAAITRLKDVLDLDFNANRLACLNAAIMLPSLAQTKQANVGDFLVQLITDPKKHEVIKLYAFKGLKEFPPARTFTDDDPITEKALVDQRKRDTARVEALLKALDHKWPVTEKSPDEEREIKAAQFIRREAIAALGSTQVPATAIVIRKNPALDGPVAYGLLRVLAKDGLTPAPSITERCEAAVGLCHLKPPQLLKPEYQPQLASYLIGRFVVDFVREYQKDYSKMKDTPKRPPYVPWKLQSERLLHGLEEFKGNFRHTPVDASFTRRFDTMHDHIKRTLAFLKVTGQVEDTNDLSQAVQALRPKGDELIVFRSFKKQPAFELP